MANPESLVTEALFLLLFLWSVWTAIRRRSVLARDVALVFAPIAALFVAQIATAVLGPLPLWLTTASALFLLAQPLFSLKLVTDLRAVPRWVLPLAVAAFALSGGLLVVTSGSRVLPITLAAVAVFVVTEAVAAAYLALEARRRHGAARVRLGIASLATAAVALVLFVAGAAAAVEGGAEVGGVAIRAIALVAALGYWIAFLPPRWLRELWQATEAFRHNERLLAARTSAEPEELWAHLARVAHDLTGAAAVVLARDEADLRVVATAGTIVDRATTYPAGAVASAGTDGSTDHVVASLLARTGFSFAKVAPIRHDGATVGVICLLRSHASLFDTDDIALVTSLAARSAMLVGRREALAEQERLTDRLELTVSALRAASAAKSDFLASMSHELRTPLNAIIGFSELMVAGAGDADQVTVPREWIDHIRNGGSHLVALINDVLDLSKVEAGRLELVRVPVDLGHAVTESVAGLRPLADRKRQEVSVAVEPVVLEVDAGRLRQILYNLVSNAIKYTGDGGTIGVSAARVGDEVRITVADNGIGIAPEDHERVFEEFRQVGEAAARASGTGLGLALTKRLVEAHGGRIELVSAIGEGSTFTVLLPAGAAIEPPAPAPVDGLAGAATGARVLIIEDDPSSVRLLQAYLAESGYQVSVAPDGETGLQMARADPPAAILLDVLLPRIDGWEVLRRLKSDPALRDVPVVIVTVVDERNVGLALGAVDYFVKPIERDALIARLDRHTFTTKVKTSAVTILAIDDDPAALDMIDATLAPLGFGVRRADSGRAGLDLAATLRPDLVICDLLMPGIDGFEVVGRLHTDPATATIPILVLTAHELTDADKARLNGRVLGVVDKGESAAQGLREWLARVTPEIVTPTSA